MSKLLPEVCPDCARTQQRCAACAEIFTHDGGPASRAGYEWADRVALQLPLDNEWPDYHGGRVAEVARRLTAGLSADPARAEELARICAARARRRWTWLRQQASWAWVLGHNIATEAAIGRARR